jgi:hypothetical protein
LNFTLDTDAVALLEKLARKYYHGNKSQTVRAALESLADHLGHDGWVVAGYAPVQLEAKAACHACGAVHTNGDVLYRPVFERGAGPTALARIPTEPWFECMGCAESRFSASRVA